MSQQVFTSLVKRILDSIAGKPIDAALKRQLDQICPADSRNFQELTHACHKGITEG